MPDQETLLLEATARIEYLEKLLDERIDKETVVQFLHHHYDVNTPDQNSIEIGLQPTQLILRFFGEMFAAALGDAPNYITSEMTLKGRGADVTDRYELTIKKLFGKSPDQKYREIIELIDGCKKAIGDSRVNIYQVYEMLDKAKEI